MDPPVDNVVASTSKAQYGLRQFKALLVKNLLLQTRSRKTLFGIGGWGALLVQILLPALFFFVMWVPKYYVKPISRDKQLSTLVKDLDSRWWSNFSPYSGPAVANASLAHILLAPDTPAVRALGQVLARTLACPPDPAKRGCPPGPPSSFHCLFLPPNAPPHCEDADTCMADSECWSHLLNPLAADEHTASSPFSSKGSSQAGSTHQRAAFTDLHAAPLSFVKDEQTAIDMALERPPWVDAIVVFKTDAYVKQQQHQAPQAAGWDGDGSGDSRQPGLNVGGQDPAQAVAGPGPQLSLQLMQYSIHMNHTDVPPTKFILDSFEVFPTKNNGLSFWKRYWFFANLEHAINRAVLGMRATELRSGYAPVAPPPAVPPDAPAAPAYPAPAQQLLLVAKSKAAPRLPPAPYDVAKPAPLFAQVKPFPWPAVKQDLGAAGAAVFFNLLLVYAFLSPARGVVAGIVREKELRLREGMRLMGLGDGAYWGSWFLTHWSTLLVSGVLCALVGTYPFDHTQLSLMLTFFALFTAALVCFSYFLSTLFSASRIAGAGAQFLYALAMLPGFAAPSVAPYAGTTWYLCCLLPPGAASLWAACLVNWELVSQGLTWHTAQLPVSQGSSFCAASVLWILAVDIVVYTLLAWYLDKVLPTSPSTPLHPLFFLRYFGRGDKDAAAAALTRGAAVATAITGNTLKDGQAGAVTVAQQAAATSPPWATLDIMAPQQQQQAQQSGGNLQQAAVYANGRSGQDTAAAGVAAAAGRVAGVVVRDLVKVFPAQAGGGHVRALDHARLRVKPAGITALLGHNGAGKTTLISILTGLEAATEGHATINGLDVAQHMHLIRQDLGVCPQFDVLWPELSVTEHLWLHGSLKGYTGDALKQVVQSAVQRVGLAGSEAVLAGDLSGGQRRKLSLAAALVGSCSVVILDEPTSGMDPYTRRFTWDLLRDQRRMGGSAVLLTTHSMEEAEELADYVVIMAAGRVVAQGTPQQLKAEFGEGYTLTLVTQPALHANSSTSASMTALGGSAGTDEAPGGSQQHQGAPGARGGDAALLQMVQEHVPRAMLLARQGDQLVVRLPREDARAFPALLRQLDTLIEQGTAGQSMRSSGSGSFLAVPAPPSTPSLPCRVTSYGMSVTTLEEVFLRVTEGAAGAPQAHGHGSTSPAGIPLTSSPQPSPSMQDGNGQVVSGLSDTGPVQWQGSLQTQGHPSQLQDRPGRAGSRRVAGLALLWQQFHALLVKRALCARRERLTLVTQLLVPLALVALSLWVSSFHISNTHEPPRTCDRSTVLVGAPTVVAGSQDARHAAAGSSWAHWLGSYAQGGPYVDSNTTQVWFRGPLEGTLDGYLLSHWYAGRAAYDALFMQQLPTPMAFMEAGNGSVLNATVMLNQSAVHSLPAALSQLADAALRYVELAGPAEHSTYGLSTGQEAVTSPAHARQQLGSGADARHGPRFQVVNKPLPTLPIEPAARVRQDAVGLLLVVCLTMASALLSASVAVHLVRERASQAKHVQLVSGARPVLYWTANLVWDYLQYSVSALGILCLIAWYQLPQYTGTRLVAVAGLLAGFGVAGLSLTYLLQRLFTDEMLALQRLNTAYFLVGYLGFVATWIIDLILIFTQPPRLKAANVWVKWLFRLVSPNFCFSKGVYDISQTYKSDLPIPIPHETNPWAWSVWGSPMAHMAAQAVVYFALTVLLDSGLLSAAQRATRHMVHWAKLQSRSLLSRAVRRPRRPVVSVADAESGLTVALLEQPPGSSVTRQGADRWEGVHQQEEGHLAPSTAGREAGDQEVPHGSVRQDEDEDVAAEREAVQAGLKTHSSQVLLSGVVKRYHAGPLAALRGAKDPHAVHAVRGLWLGVPRGECFGLLGVNGAGKTTTFNMLTGEIAPDEGDACICGHSVTGELAAARQQLGYCPQFESLLGALTPSEVLTLYARLRGVPAGEVAGRVSQLLQRLGLAGAAGRPCGTLSGGNKRKLALGVALVGEPSVHLLDEPSTGVDPGARRAMWSLLRREVMGADHSLVLTSHSMEECEALCDRLVIMVAGRAACMGSCQHLKARFGGGYVLHIKTTSAERVAEVVQALQRGPSPGAVLSEAHGADAVIHIPRASANLAALFEWLEAHRVASGTTGEQVGVVVVDEPHQVVQDYAVSQATLESVFMRMAAQGSASPSA